VSLADAPCACGRPFARLEGGILGRLDDMLIVRGVNVFPSAIEAIVRRFPVEEFRIEVFRAGEPAEVRVLVEVDGGAAGARQVQEALRAGLGLRLWELYQGKLKPKHAIKESSLFRQVIVRSRRS